MKYINPKSTVACILIKGNKILLAKRVRNPFKNYWCLPGGHVELFEKIDVAIKREIKEELNISIKPKFLNGFLTLFASRILLPLINIQATVDFGLIYFILIFHLFYGSIKVSLIHLYLYLKYLRTLSFFALSLNI